MRERRNSAGSITSVKTSVTAAFSTVTSGNAKTLSPLIQLERLLYRLNASLVQSFETCGNNRDVLLRQQARIKEYRAEIDRLHGSLSRDEFEYDNRIEWVDAQIAVFGKLEGDFDQRIAVLEEARARLRPQELDVSTKTKESSQAELPKQVAIDDVLPVRPVDKPGSSLTSSRTADSSSTPESNAIRFSAAVQSEHDQLTDELIQTVRLIKRNNIHLRSIVTADDSKISEASSLLATNADSLKSQSKNMKTYSNEAWSSTWRMLVLMFTVIVVFLFMYAFIRLT